MTRTEEQQAWQKLALSYYDGDKTALYNNALAAWDERGTPTTYQAINKLVKRGDMACYNSDILEDIKSIYGSDYDERRYINKSGEYIYKNGELYALAVYAHKIALACEKLYK